MVRYRKELLKKNQETDVDAESRLQKEKFRIEEKNLNRDKMATRSTEKRDLWIGHKLGNVITDIKIGGKKSHTDALLVQNGR